MAQYELTIVNNEGVLVLNQYELLQAEIKNFIENRPSLIINNKNDYKLVKEFRTQTNKVLKAIKDERLQTTRELLSTYEEQCKSLEKMLDEHSKALGESLKLFDEQNGNVKPKAITATLKFYDEKVLKKITKFAEENGCELTIKE